MTYKNKKFGIINANGEKIVDYKYDSIQKIPNTDMVQATVFSKNNSDIIKDGKTLLSMKNAEVLLKDNYIIVNSDSDRAYIDYEGNIVENTQMLDSELYAYKEENTNTYKKSNQKNSKWGFINKDGDIIVECKYDFVTEFNQNGFAGIKQNGKWGVINSKGEIIVEPIYEINSDNPNFVGKYYELNKGYGYNYYVCK